MFGLFGVFLLLNRRMGRSSTWMYAIIGINAVYGFVVPGIAWQGHLGGFLTGLACGGLIAYTGRRESGRDGSWTTHWLGLTVLTVALVVLAVGKYAVTSTPF